MVELNENPYFFTWTKQKTAQSLPLKSAVSATLSLQDGSSVIDLSSTSFQTSFGFNEKTILSSIQNQLCEFAIASPKAEFELKYTQSKRLLNYLKKPEGKIFYTVSGAESVENALKMARTVSGKSFILARTKCYHGASAGASAVTGDWRHQETSPLSKLTIRIPEPDTQNALERTEQLILEHGARNIAAFCLETITGANGIQAPSHDWWQGIQALCRKYSIFLIVDEVTCGFERTGVPFAFHKYDLQPDFVCMAKAISGGYIPFGALWISPEISSYYDDHVLNCGLTNYAHPLGLAAMRGVLDLLDDADFQKIYAENLQFVTAEAAKFRSISGVKEVRHHGFLMGIMVDSKQKPNWKSAIDHGVHLMIVDDLIIVAPPFVMTPQEKKSGFQSLTKFIESLV